jgi:hypothetical protein
MLDELGVCHSPGPRTIVVLMGRDPVKSTSFSSCGLLDRPEARRNAYRAQEAQMRAWNRRAFVAVALALSVAWLSSIISNAQETNGYGFVSSAQAQPAPIRKLIEWLRGMTMPAGIVKEEGRIEATQIDVSSKYAGELVDVTVQEGLVGGQVIARLKSPGRGAIETAQSNQSARRRGVTPSRRRKPGRQINSMISDLRVVAPRKEGVRCAWGDTSWRARRS